jgi:hypothetical protein
MAKTLLCAFLVCLSVIGASAQAQTNYTLNLLKQLLDLPAPPRVNPTGDVSFISIKPERPDGFYDSKNIPPDDAPLEILLDFWERQSGSFDEFRHNLRPSKETLRRLMEAIDSDHEKLDNFIKLFPTDPDVADFVQRIYKAEKEEAKTSGSWLDTVRRWLRNNSDMFLNELLTDVRDIQEEDGRVNNQEELIALAKIDWNAAKSFIDALERDGRQTGTYTLAKYVLYHHALKEENSGDVKKYRAELQQIVEDKTASHKARDLAMDALVLGGDFEGRDDWYISLLNDETLLELQDNGYTGLTTLVRYSPNDREKWVSLMTKLLSGGNPTLRSVAVRNLFEIKGLDRETALLLLPWLSDRAWASGSDDRERIRLMAFLEDNDIPEGVPGLIRVLMSEDGYLRGSAAKALVRYKSPSAIPALRSALQDETDTDYREHIIEALIAAGGISDAEQLAGLEAYAVSIANEKVESENSEEYSENDEDEDKPVSIEISIGTFLKSCENPRDSLVSMTVRRIKVLKKTNPKLAGILYGIIQTWKSRIVDLEMLESAGGAKADVEMILKILIRRAGMRERIPNELSMMRDKNAIQRALSAVITENISDQAYMLSADGDADSRIALLALARLVRSTLPVGEVGALLNDPNKTLALAAERYLESEDSVEARKLILARRKGEVRILGSQNAFVADEKKNYDTYRQLLSDLFNDVNGSDYWTVNLSELNKTENDLRAEFKTGTGLIAVYAFISDSDVGQKVLRVYNDKIVFTFYEDGSRYWEKIVAPKDYEAMYNFLIQNRIDELAQFSTCGRDCRSREFVMFGRDGGRRIFYRQYSTPLPLKALEEMFDSFNTGERRLHYWIADKLPGVEVLMSAENFEARAFWKNGDDFRVLIEDKEKEKAILDDVEMQEKSEDANVNLTYSERSEIQRARRTQVAYRHFSWRKFENGQLGNEVSQPAGIAFLSANMQVISWGGKSVYAPTPTTYRRRAGNFEIRTDSGYYSGNLIKVFDSGATAAFKEGKYSHPLVTPDGKWIVAAKRDEDSSRITSVVRIDLQTGKEFDVNIPPADDFSPVAFADAHNKMLLYRARDEDNDSDEDNPSPKTPEYYLLDANTGAFQLVRGEFRPLEDQTFRGLQPTGNANEFWAAIYDEKTRVTQIGFYDARLFAFKPILNLPKIALDSMDIFVDKPAAKLYFVYGGHLLSLPLAAAQNQP